MCVLRCCDFCCKKIKFFRYKIFFAHPSKRQPKRETAVNLHILCIFSRKPAFWKNEYMRLTLYYSKAWSNQTIPKFMNFSDMTFTPTDFCTWLLETVIYTYFFTIQYNFFGVKHSKNQKKLNFPNLGRLPRKIAGKIATTPGSIFFVSQVPNPPKKIR